MYISVQKVKTGLESYTFTFLKLLKLPEKHSLAFIAVIQKIVIIISTAVLHWH